MPKKMRGAAKTKTPDPVRREFARLARRMKLAPVASDETRRERGLRTLTGIVGVRGGKVLNDLVAFSPEVTRDIVDHAYGSVLAEVKLDERTRALVVVAALAAMGNAQPELRVHLGSALNSGCTRREILDTLRVVALYAGFPAALNGLAAAREALPAKDTPKKTPRAVRR
jgi:4-carboxymuconolactone decarboxylase